MEVRKAAVFFQNEIDGKSIDCGPTSNLDNTSISKAVVYIVSGETFSLQAFLWVQDSDSYTFDDTDPELANVLWKTTGNIGYFVSEGNATATGATTSVTITGAAGAKGTLELDGLRCSYPVKVVATQADLPESD